MVYGSGIMSTLPCMYDAPWARGIVGKQVSVEGMAQQTRNGHSASAAEVAALAGVSRQTVSRVVNGMPNVTEKTRKRVLAAMEELGFRPNFAGAALRGGSYRSIGLCMYNITRVGNLATLEGIMQAAREHDFAVTMIEMGGDKPYTLADASRRMVERPVDGMILNMNRMAPDFEEFVPQPGVRTVILSMYAHPRCTTIDSDQYGSCELLTNYLLEHGHSNMRFVAGPENSISSRFREAGWRDTLGRAHVDAAPMLRGDWSADSGYAMGERIAAEVLAGGSQAPTAVLAANDQMALGVIAALENAGLSVPDDVSVVGIDDALEGLVPHNRLTTLRFDLRGVGKLAFEAAIGESSSIEAIHVPSTLVERSTVRDIRG